MSEAKQVYSRRNQRLKRAGYSTYRDYLKSPEWVALRTRVFLHFGSKCFRCGAKSACIHHTNYSPGTLSGVHTGGLVPLCEGCHKYAEYDGERKCSPEEANRRLGLRLDRKCDECGHHRSWNQFRYADDRQCLFCWKGQDHTPKPRPGGRVHRLKKFALVGGSHHGEQFKPDRNGKGLPTLVSRTCELAGGMGVCRSTYQYDPQRRAYVFSKQIIS